MIASDGLPCRLLAFGGAAALSLLLALPVVTRAANDAGLTATLQLPEGEIDFSLETGTIHFFDEENAPFAVQVIDGCAVNDRFWVLGAGLGSTAAPLTVFDERTGLSHRLVLPAFRPGEPVGVAFDPEALAICREGPRGGLPPVGGTAIYTSVTPTCSDETATIELLSEGRDDAYRSFERDRSVTGQVISDVPIVVVDDDGERDELHLFAEARTPRLVEGVLFSGDEGMLPGRAKLDKALKGVTKARVRRAFEAAKGWTIPKPLIEELGLEDVGCVYHVSLAFDTLGADAYLAQAGWIEDGGAPLLPPQLVEQRFTVELVQADGQSSLLPLSGPFEGSGGAVQYWEHASEDAKVQIIDGCALSGTFWTVAAAVTAEPLELVVTDTQTGASASSVLWTDREEVARLADTASLASCP